MRGGGSIVNVLQDCEVGVLDHLKVRSPYVRSP